jgi:hypothetical protein
MRSLVIVALTLVVVAGSVSAKPVKDLEQELKTLEIRLTELTMSALEARFTRPGGPVLRLYDVADLTTSLTDFVRPNIAIQDAGSEFDEDSPLFGRTHEGPVFFDADELAETLRSNVRPEIWNNAATLEIQGQTVLVAAPREVHAEVNAALNGLRSRLGRLVTIEIHAVSAAAGSLPSEPLSEEAFNALLAKLGRGEGGTILSSAEVTGYAGQRMMVFSGDQRAFIQDYDVEVAQSAKIQDPIVGVFHEGLTFDVRAMPQGLNAGVLVDLRADFAIPVGEPRLVETSAGKVELPHHRRCSVSGTFTLSDGGGLAIGGTSKSGTSGSRVTLLARARLNAVVAGTADTADRATELQKSIASTRRLIGAYEAAMKARGPIYEMRLYAVDDLVFPIEDRPGPQIGLRPSGAHFFSEDEAEYAVDTYEPEQIVELITSHVAPGSWDELHSVSIECADRNLVVVHTPGAHAMVSEFLRNLRSRMGRTVAVDVEIVSLTAADRRALGASSPTLSAKALAQLRTWIAEGRVTRMHTGRILAANNQRVALVDLEPVAYVMDYDVEIAEASSIADPIIRQLEQGLVVEVRPIVAGNGSQVVLECRMTRAVLAPGPIPNVQTTVGAIDTPRVRYTRVGCTLSVATGSTVVVGGGLNPTAESTATHSLLLLTPRIVRASGK